MSDEPISAEGNPWRRLLASPVAAEILDGRRLPMDSIDELDACTDDELERLYAIVTALRDGYDEVLRAVRGKLSERGWDG